MKKHIQTILVVAILLHLKAFSQVSIPSNGGGIPANYVGWNALQAFPVRVEHKGNQNIDFFNGFGVLAAQRMTILGVAGPTQGFVGIGVAAPTDLLHIHDGNSSNLHVTNGGSGSGALSGVKFGLLNNTVHALIAQQSTNALSKIFFTTNGAPTLANVKVTINNNGNVGIGTGFISPNNKLDVEGGDIDVNTPQRSYMIADSSVLWHKGSTSNILVGVGAIV